MTKPQWKDMQEASNCRGLPSLQGDAEPQQSRVRPSGTCGGESREPWRAGLAPGPRALAGWAGSGADMGPRGGWGQGEPLALCCPSSALAEGRLPTGGMLRWFWDPQMVLGPRVVWKPRRCELGVPKGSQYGGGCSGLYGGISKG